MRTSEHNGYLILLVEVHHRRTMVVRCPVLQDDRIVPPVLRLLLQQLEEVGVKHLHHIRVGVCLKERNVKGSVGVDCSDHAHSRLHLLLGQRIQVSWERPLPTTKVTHPKPGLVNVDHHLLVQVQLEKCLRELLAEDEVLRIVGFPRDGLHLLVSHAHVVVEKVHQFRRLHLQPEFLLELLLNVFH